LTLPAIDRAYQFIADHGDIILYHFDNGIPWEEALNAAPYPKHVTDDWADRLQRTDDNMPIILAITPMNSARDGLAPYWSNRGDNRRLPRKWRRKDFNDPDVITAYSHYALEMVAQFDPAYLAIGIESNLLVSFAPEKWDAYLELNAAVYVAVKQAHPDLPVFSSVQYEHLRGIDDDAKPNLALQAPAVTQLLNHSDLLGLSTYRYGFFHPNPPNDGYFDIALSFGKPVAITESGALSQGIVAFGTALPSDENLQLEFISMLLEQAQEHNFPFVINWVNVDFDGTLDKLPSNLRDLATIWVYTGLETFDGRAKPVLEVWQSCLEN